MVDVLDRRLDEPALHFDPYSPEFATNPYPIYRRLRDEAPLYYQEDMNFWLLTRYDDVWRAHQNAVDFSSSAGPSIERIQSSGTLIAKDAPEHGWAKAMMTKVFSRARMAALDPFIRSRAAELIEAAADQAAGGEIDLVSSFSVKLPLDVISELLGIPEELRHDIHHLSNIWVMRGTDVDVEEQNKDMARLFGIYLDLTKQRRAVPKDDPISLLIATEVKDEQGVMHRLTDEEIAWRFLEMGFAGHETVAKTIAAGAMALTLFPDQRAKLAADLSLMPKAVQEILRFDPPSQLQGRVTTRELTMYGMTIPADARVMMATGSATRDERAFPDPDRFDIERVSDGRTVFFGYGVHKCLGIHLAQQELAIAFEELFRRFPDWTVFPERTTYRVLSNVRGASNLPMVLGRHS